MATYIAAIGLIVLHVCATAVLWFVSRSRERRLIERIDRARDAVLDAINSLRGDLAAAGRGGPPPEGGEGGLSTPFLPTQGQIEAAHLAHEKEVIRARWEAEEDERERARKDALNAVALQAAQAGNVPTDERPEITPPPVALPSASAVDHSDSDAGTQVFLASNRRTMLGGLAHDGPPRPRSAHPTLASRIELPAPRADVASRMTASIAARYEELCAAARTAGLSADHCNDTRTDCHDCDRNHAAGACLCTCDGCTRATSYVDQAEREIMGPPQGHTPRSGR